MGDGVQKWSGLSVEVVQDTLEVRLVTVEEQKAVGNVNGLAMRVNQSITAAMFHIPIVAYGNACRTGTTWGRSVEALLASESPGHLQFYQRRIVVNGSN